VEKIVRDAGFETVTPTESRSRGTEKCNMSNVTLEVLAIGISYKPEIASMATPGFPRFGQS